MNNYHFSKRSLDKLAGVHPELILVASRALLYSEYDFAITHGVRTLEEQKKLVADGKSQTMNSYHLTGDAIDIMVYKDGKGSWLFEHYETVARAFKRAADELKVDLTWGGDWTTFKDGPHFQRARD